MVNGASQSGLLTSQLAKPDAHRPALQVVAPSWQVNIVLATSQRLSPHAPQSVLVPSAVSQPSLTPPQSAKPSTQVAIAHWPATHVDTAFHCEHWCPHEPQL